MSVIGEMFVKLGVTESAAFKRIPADIARIGDALGNVGRNTGMWSNLNRQIDKSGALINDLGRDWAGLTRDINRASAAAANFAGKSTLASRMWSPGRGAGLAGHAAMGQLRADLSGEQLGWAARHRAPWAEAHRRIAAGRTGLPEILDTREYVLGGTVGSGLREEAVMGAAPPNAPKRPGMLAGLGARWRNAQGGGRRGGSVGGGFGGHSGGSRFGALGTASSLNRMLMGLGAFQAVQGFGKMADTYSRLQMRIEGITESESERQEVFSRLKQISRDTNVGLEQTVEGFVRIKHATEGMQLSDEQRYKLMTNINKLMATSGASAQEASSGIRQLTQAFSKGKLDGDEFKSIAENMPNVLKVLTKSLGVTEGQLRDMSESGRLTRDVLVKALMNAEGLQEPVHTFETTWQKFKDGLMESFGVFAKENNMVEDFGEVLKEVSRVINQHILPGLKKLLVFLKENTWVIKALLGMGVAAFFWTVAKAIIGFPIGVLMDIVKAYRLLGVAKRFAMGAGAAEAAVGAAGAAGAAGTAGAAAGAASGGSKLGKAASIASKVILPIAAAEIINELTGGSVSNDWLNTMAGKQIFPTTQGAQSGGNNVNMGGVNITVNAQDGTDAGKKIVEELDKQLRGAI